MPRKVKTAKIEPIIEEPKVEEEKKEEATPKLEEEEEKPKEPEPLTLDEQVLAIYNNAEEGENLLHKMVVETGARENELMQAWDRLFDYHKVSSPKIPYTK